MDAHDLFEMERRLTAAADKLARHADAVSMARACKEFCSDQRKNLLASYKVKHRKESDTDSGQDTLARADEDYQRELADMKTEFQRAEKHCAQWDAEHCVFSAAQSSLAMARELTKI